MIRRILIVFALFVAVAARANVFSISNDMTLATCTDRLLPVDVAYQFRMTVQASQSGVPISLSNRYVRFRLYDLRDGQAVIDQRGEITDAGQCQFVIAANVSTIQPGNYEAKSESWRTNDTLAAVLSCDRVSLFKTVLEVGLTNNPLETTGGGGGGGGGATSVVVTVTATSAPPNVSVIATQIIVNVTQPSGVFSINGATGTTTLIVQPGWIAGISTNVATGDITLTTGLPNGTTNVAQVASWDGSAWSASAIGAPGQTPNVGTNWTTFTNLYPTTNTWVVPGGVTQVLITAWGAAGHYSGGGGFVEALWVGTPGTILSIVNGTAGTAATNGMPGGGAGINGGTIGQFGGAGYTAVYQGTGIVVISAGAGNGVGSQSVYGGAGGGFYRDTNNGVPNSPSFTTNGQCGQGAWATNEYGLGATGGTNLAISGTSQNGTFLQGGAASTNGCTLGVNGTLGGGGGGYYGGAGATRTNSLAGAGLVSGGGGVSYGNTNYCTFVRTYRGQQAVNGVPAGQDRPTYISGKATASGPGLVGFQW